MAYRVVADHIRTLTIALSDGAVPSNDGRGYVLRRILRRGVRYGREILKAPVGFFHQLVDSVVEILGEAFPELTKSPEDVRAIIKEEEMQFCRTLDKGIKTFNAMAAKVTNGVFSGDDVFTLYSVSGFPADLTELMAEELGLKVDMDRFHQRMEELREMSRNASNFSNLAALDLQAAQTDELAKARAVRPTEDAFKYEWDSTGAGELLETTVQAIWDGKKFIDDASSASGPVGVIFDKTTFYAEAGGQIFDEGEVVQDGLEFRINNVQKYGGFVMHCGKVGMGSLKVGQTVSVKVDFTRRSLVAKNHSATHILNFALRQVLGAKVDQRGSLCAPDKLRFDFAYTGPIESEDLKKVEDIVNAEIAKNKQCYMKDTPLEMAQKINGLRAVFGETYPDPVRVVAFGESVDTLTKDMETNFGSMTSIEFCGGTHVANSSEIYRFVIQTEEGIAKGVRRIVAVTGPQAAVESVLKAKQLFIDVEEMKTLSGALLDGRISELRQKMSEDRELPLVRKREMLGMIEDFKKKQLEKGKEAMKQALAQAKVEAAKFAELYKGEKYAIVQFPDIDGDAKILSQAAEVCAKESPDTAWFMIAGGSARIAVLVCCPKGANTPANEWMKAALAPANGKGGGSPVRAQGQSQEPGKLSEVVAAAEAYLNEKK